MIKKRHTNKQTQLVQYVVVRYPEHVQSLTKRLLIQTGANVATYTSVFFFFIKLGYNLMPPSRVQLLKHLEEMYQECFYHRHNTELLLTAIVCSVRKNIISECIRKVQETKSPDYKSIWKALTSGYISTAYFDYHVERLVTSTDQALTTQIMAAKQVREEIHRLFNAIYEISDTPNQTPNDVY